MKYSREQLEEQKDSALNRITRKMLDMGKDFNPCQDKFETDIAQTLAMSHDSESYFKHLVTVNRAEIKTHLDAFWLNELATKREKTIAAILTLQEVKP